MTHEWIGVLAPFASGAFGVGIAWGVMRQKYIDLERRVSITENKLELQVGQTRCDRMREECRDTLKDTLEEIKAEIINNRNFVIEKFSDIARFMGKHNGDVTR